MSYGHCDVHKQEADWMLAAIQKSKFKQKAPFCMYNLITQNINWFTYKAFVFVNLRLLNLRTTKRKAHDQRASPPTGLCTVSSIQACSYPSINSFTSLPIPNTCSLTHCYHLFTDKCFFLNKKINHFPFPVSVPFSCLTQ